MIYFSEMKKIITLIVLLFVSQLSISQKDFCDGWENGFKDGSRTINRQNQIVPICPIPKINNDTYSVGYQLGYQKATGKTVAVIEKTDKTDYCDGWEKGYLVALQELNKGSYLVANCPPKYVNNNPYDTGFIEGYRVAMEKYGTKDASINIVVEGNTDDTYCDGWERGYRLGLEIWAKEYNRRASSRSTPTCPTPRINQDQYSDGFNHGQARAKKDMQP